MKVSKMTLDPEKKLLTQMIVSHEFITAIMPVFKYQYLKSSASRIVGEWLVEFFEFYKTNPGKGIQDIYNAKKKTIRTDEESALVASFLTKLSVEYEDSIPNNIEYSINQAIHYLKIRSFEIAVEDLQYAIQKDDHLLGEQVFSSYSRVERVTGEGTSMLHDTQDVISAFMEEDELLFRMPGAFGTVAGDFNRGDFITFIAPMKRGKTFMLWYAAEVAMNAGCKVIFFTLEMTKKQMIRRAWKSMMGQPKTDMEIAIPYFSVAEQDPVKYEVLEKIEERKALDPNKVERMQRKLRRLMRSGDVKIIQLSGYSATVADLEAHLDTLSHYDNYVPDVIVVDYADLLAPSKKAGNEYRHKLDDVWKGLRRVSQERNILIITASQSNKESIDRDMKQGDVAEDIRKIAHVTSAIALNQKKEEQQKGILRASQMAIRDGKQCTSQAVLLQCLDIGKICLDSRLQCDMVIDKDNPTPHKGRRSCS